MLYRTNLRAPFLFMKHVIPIIGGRKRLHFQPRVPQRKIGVAGLGGYTASSSGSWAREVLYRELAAQGSRSTLCPGWVNTDMASGEGCVIPGK